MVEKLIKEASQERTLFSPRQLAELRKILDHNDQVPKGKKVSAEKAAEYFSLHVETFRRYVKRALGRSFGGVR